MIKVDTITEAEYEHGSLVQTEVTLSTTKSFLYPEIVSLLEKCYEVCPEITLNAIERALDKMQEGDIND